jgi:hypothetical protein
MAKAAVANPPDEPDELIPDPTVWREFGISSMTGWRWTRDKTLDFPPPIKIRNRCFRSRRQLEEFKRRMVATAVAGRKQSRAHGLHEEVVT